MDAATRHWEAARKAKGQPTHIVETVKIGPYAIDFAARTVELNGDRVELALKEFDLLAHLARTPGRVCSREEIMGDGWGIGAGDQPTDDKTLDVHMYRLRTKLENDPSRPQWIITVRGVGYLLDDGRRPVRS